MELILAREGTELRRAEGHVTGHPTFSKALHLLQLLPHPHDQQWKLDQSNGLASSSVKIIKYPLPGFTASLLC